MDAVTAFGALAERAGVAAASDPPEAVGSPDRPVLRLLALATQPALAASTRFRVLQWRPVLERAGFSLTLEAFCSPRAAAILYQPGRVLEKCGWAIAGAVRRARVLLEASRRAEALFIHREVFPLGHRPCWRALERFPGPVIYDYDDAMFLPQRRDRKLLRWLERVETPKRAMALSDVVLAGNPFLAAYARRYARRVVVLPTCIETDRFAPPARPREPRDRPTIGWIGSSTTSKYLVSLIAALEAVAERTPFCLYAVGCQPLPPIRGVQVEQVHWTVAREVEDFQRCDIGVYPLWDDEWARGKCGFKAIQFMACGVPVVAAAVGMNRGLIQDGVNGYLAPTEEAWVERLRRLLADQALRERLGRAGRRTVEEGYSVRAHAGTLIGALRGAVRRDANMIGRR